jgi:hypothetical protein
MLYAEISIIVFVLAHVFFYQELKLCIYQLRYHGSIVSVRHELRRQRELALALEDGRSCLQLALVLVLELL